MSVDWGSYTAFRPGVDRPLGELPRREARAAFHRLMEAKADRISNLRTLLALNGVELSSDDAGLQQLDDWFQATVQGDVASGRLLSIWYGVVNDVALFLGDVMVERSPNLKWVMFDMASRGTALHRHVIMGFSRVENPKYNVDIDWLVAVHGHRIIAGLSVDPNKFVAAVRYTETVA